jgi:teichoic acid transport system ATP-binding protein
MIQAGTSAILVSHNLPLVEELCTRVLWLHQGEIRHIGPASETIRMYQKAGH